MALVIMCILSDIDIYMMYMMYVCTAEAISMRDTKWRMVRDVRVWDRDLEDVQLLTNERRVCVGDMARDCEPAGMIVGY